MGEYELEKYFVNGEDSSDVILSIMGDCDYTYLFTENLHNRTSIVTDCNTFLSDTCERFFGLWYFADRGKKITITGYSSASGWTFPFQTFEETEWQILRLKSKEMWIAADINGSTLELRFKKIKQLK